jgi:putative ABC transport system permease protein
MRVASIQVDDETKTVSAVDHRSFGDLIEIELSDGSWDALESGTLMVHKDPARDLDLSVGDDVTARFQSTGTQTLRVVAIYDDASIVGNWVIDLSTYDANFTGVPLDFFVAATVNENASLETVKGNAKTLLLDEAPSVEVRDKDEFRKSQEKQIDILLVVINVLLGLSVGIALIGIANTLALSVHERTRELGLMRAVGMQRAQTKSMVRWESVLVAVFGALLGVVLGVTLGIVVSIALPEGVVTRLSIPVPQLALYVVMSILAGIWAARAPAKRAAKMNVLDAIAHN